MKTSLLDYLTSTALLGTIGGLSALLTASGVAPASRAYLGAYHVLADAFAFLLFYGLLAVVAVRGVLFLRPLEPGAYDMESPLFFYWKLTVVLYEFGKGALLPFTTVFARPVVAALFGARMGRGVAMGGRFGDPWLVEVGDGAVIGAGADIVAHAITSGRIVLKGVKLGRGATVGLHSVLMPGVEVGENSVVTAGSVVTMDTRIPPNEMWGGVPARKIKDLEGSDARG